MPAPTRASALRDVRGAWTRLRVASADKGLADPAATVYGGRIALVLDAKYRQLSERATRAITDAPVGLAGYEQAGAGEVVEALRVLAAVC
jgi:hypothetical protein